MGFGWSWNGLLKNAAQQGMEGYTPGTPQAPQGYVPYEALLNQRGLSNNMQPDNSVIPGTTYQPDNFGNRQPQAVTQMEAEQQAQRLAEQEAAAKQQRIASIQSDIKVLEQRIADNTMKLRNFTGNRGQIAAIEARKINTQDPTSIWRWKEGLNQQRIQRQEDLARIEAEKVKNEAKNKELNQYKIESILKNTMPFNAKTRDELLMMQKNLNDAEELAKQYKDIDMLKKIDERRTMLEGHEPISEKSNRIESDFIKNLSMVGKKGGMSKADFIDYVNKVLADNEEIWRYNPGLQQKLYQVIGAKAQGNKGPFELE